MSTRRLPHDKGAAIELVSPPVTPFTDDRANAHDEVLPAGAGAADQDLRAMSWALAAALWAHWRRERKVASLVAHLRRLDDRTLTAMGIGHRAEIERHARTVLAGSGKTPVRPC